MAEPINRGAVLCVLVGPGHDLDDINARFRGQGLQRAPQHRPAEDWLILLGHTSAGALSLARGDDQSGNPRQAFLPCFGSKSLVCRTKSGRRGPLYRANWLCVSPGTGIA